MDTSSRSFDVKIVPFEKTKNKLKETRHGPFLDNSRICQLMLDSCRTKPRRKFFESSIKFSGSICY